MKDNYGRSIRYMRISVTDRCNLRCRYCMPPEGIEHKKSHQDVLSYENMVKIVRAGADLGIEKIRLTGGEPLSRKGIVEFVDEIKHIEGIKEISMTTNGVLLPRYIDDLVRVGVDRFNISMDTLKPDRFKTITGFDEFAEVGKAIEMILMRKILPLKVNTVLIKGFNDDEVENMIDLTKKYPIELRFIELMPIGEASGWTSDKFLSLNYVKSILQAKSFNQFIYDDISSPAHYYSHPDYKGKIGLIEPITCQFCSNCNRIRMTADGKLKPCLHTNEEIDLKPYLDQGNEAIKKVIERSILSKPEKHHIGQISFEPIKRGMNRIGG